MRVIALPEFLACAERLLSKDERAEFADYIGANPEAGKVIPGLKGVRKVRWGRGNVGKRGGVRIIYLYVVVKSTIYLLTIYAKAQQEDLAPTQRRAILREVATLKGEQQA
ncbi:MAG: addiction module toxin RelE [Bryobacteraceae bacterium]|jgi:mRNA-degrading endonuclease RelE of RelBE toxin-antitoxin system